MSVEQVEATGAAALPAPEPVRVMVPSQLGPLAVDFHHTAIGRVLFSPAARERKLYHPLADFEESEFLDEVFGRISEYLAGARRTLELEYDLGPSGLDAFARRVLKEVARTPYGKTRTYKEIAEQTGFFDQSHFIKAFKQATGMTPGLYRRQRGRGYDELLEQKKKSS